MRALCELLLQGAATLDQLRQIVDWPESELRKTKKMLTAGLARTEQEEEYCLQLLELLARRHRKQGLKFSQTYELLARACGHLLEPARPDEKVQVSNDLKHLLQDWRYRVGNGWQCSLYQVVQLSHGKRLFDRACGLAVAKLERESVGVAGDAVRNSTFVENVCGVCG